MTNLRFAALGIDHRHIYGMSEGMIEAGCELVGYWTEGEPQPLSGFIKRFPDAERYATRQRILDDETIPLVLIAAPPVERAALAIEAMRHGKDVMIDKPGCLTLAELAEIRQTVKETGRIWSVDFSERFEVRAVAKATELVRAGKIGDLVQMLSTGPHRLNLHMRPDWFFDPVDYGGILGDIGTHQIDQFLHFAGADTAEIVHAAVGNFANPDLPKFQDWGELNLRAGNKQAYIRVDWYTADALPNWGDGRLFLYGTEGEIELRKYVDLAGRPGTDHLFLVNGSEYEYFDCSAVELPYFRQVMEDVLNRTETACGQTHTFTATELAIRAQAKAELRGNLKP